MIDNIFNKTLDLAKKNKWDTIYIAIDWHDTLTKSTYTNETALNFYTDAIKTLKLLSSLKIFKLILFTSSYDDKCKELLDHLKEHNVYFDYVNENPEVENTEFGDFSKKFYYNILIDDKAGFDPDEWSYLKVWIIDYLANEY